MEITNRVYHRFQARRQRHPLGIKAAGLLRFRINGHLRDIVHLPEKVTNAMIVRIKFLAEMDIANSLTPQDGRFAMEVAAYEQNFRISACPGLHGEKSLFDC